MNNTPICQRTSDPLNYELQLMISTKNSATPVSCHNLRIFIYTVKTSISLHNLSLNVLFLILVQCIIPEIQCVHCNYMGWYSGYLRAFSLKLWQTTTISNIFEVLFKTWVKKSLIWLQRFAKDYCCKQFWMIYVNDLFLDHSTSQRPPTDVLVSKVYLYFEGLS